MVSLRKGYSKGRDYGDTRNNDNWHGIWHRNKEEASTVPACTSFRIDHDPLTFLPRKVLSSWGTSTRWMTREDLVTGKMARWTIEGSLVWSGIVAKYSCWRTYHPGVQTLTPSYSNTTKLQSRSCLSCQQLISPTAIVFLFFSFFLRTFQPKIRTNYDRSRIERVFFFDFDFLSPNRFHQKSRN